MIILPSEDGKRKRSTAAVAPSVYESQDDPPPTYTALVPDAPILRATSPDSLVPARQTATQTAMQPSNYISISRNNTSVRGAWLLDPSLLIPSIFLPPLLPDETEETRRNLYIKSSNGSIDADITLAPFTVRDEAISKKRSTICTRAINGPIRVTLHAPHAPRLPFYLNVDASNGAVAIFLPRPFNGLLSIRQSHGRTKFSPEVSMHLTTFSDIERMHRCFIGDYSAIMEGQEWQGDEVVIDARNGSVNVHYEGEILDQVGKQPAGFLGKLFRI
ncbi:hypothetical protein E4T56_gene2102 [Termitomyces sp. T112]|nr:hypothetical protein E4T56_gene2102 [Termitomyces sp. T112]KAH0582085.1 hypothetical protein H2248_011740 [Termitomyces sp. 'cryptogamus']